MSDDELREVTTELLSRVEKRQKWISRDVNVVVVYVVCRSELLESDHADHGDGDEYENSDSDVENNTERME